MKQVGEREIEDLKFDIKSKKNGIEELEAGVYEWESDLVRAKRKLEKIKTKIEDYGIGHEHIEDKNYMRKLTDELDDRDNIVISIKLAIKDFERLIAKEKAELEKMEKEVECCRRMR